MIEILTAKSQWKSKHVFSLSFLPLNWKIKSFWGQLIKPRGEGISSSLPNAANLCLSLLHEAKHSKWDKIHPTSFSLLNSKMFLKIFSVWNYLGNKNLPPPQKKKRKCFGKHLILFGKWEFLLYILSEKWDWQILVANFYWEN